MSEAFGPQLQEPEHVAALMQPLMIKFDAVVKVVDGCVNDDLIPLLECLMSVVAALQGAMLPYCTFAMPPH
jgi:hypothetical protein